MRSGRERLSRRGFLVSVLGATAAVVAARTRAAGPATEIVQTTLAPGITLLSGAGGNVTVFDSPEGVLLVDGGSAARSADLLAAVAKLTGKPRVHTLFNTHWHHDQTGSNATLGAAGARILAHENTRLWLGTEVDSVWESRQYTRLPPKAWPNETFYSTGTLSFGGEQIDYGPLPVAHTDGDIYVHFRKANVLVGGDVLSSGAFPVIDYCTGGWVGGLADATAALMQLGNDQTRYVGGQGGPLTRAQVAAEHAMLKTMRERLAKLLAQGMSAKEMVDAKPAADFGPQWGDATLFISNAWPGLVYRARELGVSIV